MLPQRSVLRGSELLAFDAPTAARVEYTSQPVVDFPVVPIQAFGVYYALDLVIVSDHPDWDMHEYARIDTPQGVVWMAKDSDIHGVQTIIAGLQDIQTWVPSIPVPRQYGEVTVNDRSEGDWIDVDLSYVNVQGQLVEVEVTGTIPDHPPRRRNGSTMSHSQQVTAAVLDLERFGRADHAEISIGGQRREIESLGGVKLQFLLEQAQGGFSIANHEWFVDESGLRLARPIDGEEWSTHSQERWLISQTDTQTTIISRDDGYTRHRCGLVSGGLSWITVEQHGRPEPVFELYFHPALPDVRRQFSGDVTSRFRMDVNGQRGHGVGDVVVSWVENVVQLKVNGQAPWWLAQRPMLGTVEFTGDQTVEVRTERVFP